MSKPTQPRDAHNHLGRDKRDVKTLKIFANVAQVFRIGGCDIMEYLSEFGELHRLKYYHAFGPWMSQLTTKSIIRSSTGVF